MPPGADRPSARRVTRPAGDVTVVVPVFDRARLLARALHGVAAQTVAPAEVLVVDDGSTDASADVARDLGARVIGLPGRSGSGAARDAAIRAARTEWVAFLDSDDVWHPTHLARLLGAAADTVDLVTSPALTLGGEVRGHVGRRSRLLEVADVLTGDVICTSGTMARRTALERAGGFSGLPRAQDLDTWVRVLDQGRGVALPGPTLTYDLHPGQASLDEDLTLACLRSIHQDCLARGSADQRVLDRAMARRHWELAARARREGRPRAAGAELRWIATRPATWTTLARNLRDRRRAVGRTG